MQEINSQKFLVQNASGVAIDVVVDWSFVLKRQRCHQQVVVVRVHTRPRRNDSVNLKDETPKNQDSGG